MSKEVEISVKGDLSVVELRPTDKIVVRTSMPLQQTDRVRVAEAVAAWADLKPGCVLVLPHFAELTIVRQAQEQGA